MHQSPMRRAIRLTDRQAVTGRCANGHFYDRETERHVVYSCAPANTASGREILMSVRLLRPGSLGVASILCDSE
jgi:hypothetical protein